VAGRIKDIIAGVRLVGAGFKVWRSSPRLMLIGLIPGAISAALLTGLFVAIVVWVDDWARGLAQTVTSDPTPNGLVVALFGVAIIGGGVLLGVYTFTAVTLLIGQPFFEAIADRVAPGAGLVYTDAEEAWWRSSLRGVRDGIALLSVGAFFGITFFLVGLIPAVGAPIAFVGAAFVGGSLLALELTAYPLARVGVFTLAERRGLVRARRSLALGFGVTAYLVCLIPFGAVLAMPALVAGGTMLAARIAPEGASRGDYDARS
jgi:CysZ protein